MRCILLNEVADGNIKIQDFLEVHTHLNKMRVILVLVRKLNPYTFLLNCGRIPWLRHSHDPYTIEGQRRNQHTSHY